ncbi:MAG: VOC family protein [Pseudomonadota bacterium]|nr:VOC family protein [Pseudomonadota bacterium]
MFTYICLGSDDLDRSIRFYDPTMGALGLPRVSTGDAELDRTWAGWGLYKHDGANEIALWVCNPFDGNAATAGNGTMIALKAKSWEEVENFHAAAVAFGGTSDGRPGLRPQYNPDFYAAYVRDPDGNKLAAVCRGFTAPQR